MTNNEYETELERLRASFRKQNEELAQSLKLAVEAKQRAEEREAQTLQSCKLAEARLEGELKGTRHLFKMIFKNVLESNRDRD